MELEELLNIILTGFLTEFNSTDLPLSFTIMQKQEIILLESEQSMSSVKLQKELLALISKLVSVVEVFLEVPVVQEEQPMLEVQEALVELEDQDHLLVEEPQEEDQDHHPVEEPQEEDQEHPEEELQEEDQDYLDVYLVFYQTTDQEVHHRLQIIQEEDIPNQTSQLVQIQIS